MEEFALIKSRVNLNRVNLGIALISDLKVGKELYRLRITRLKETRGNKSWVITAL